MRRGLRGVDPARAVPCRNGRIAARRSVLLSAGSTPPPILAAAASSAMAQARPSKWQRSRRPHLAGPREAVGSGRETNAPLGELVAFIHSRWASAQSVSVISLGRTKGREPLF